MYVDQMILEEIQLWISLLKISTEQRSVYGSSSLDSRL